MVLKCGPSSSRTRSSSHGRDVRRGLVSFMRLILAPVDGDRAAERGDRILGELVVGDLHIRRSIGVETVFGPEVGYRDEHTGTGFALLDKVKVLRVQRNCVDLA